MRVVGYTRVSTAHQAAEGYGLDAQEHALRTWAKCGGHRLVAVTADEGLSGTTPPDERPGLVEALSMVAQGKADAVAVYRLDRLARDLVLQEQLLAEIRRAGGVLRSTSASEDHLLEDAEDDPTRALIRQVLGAVAQYERHMIRLRMKAGRMRKAAAGGYAGGRPPYGWRAVGHELQPVTEEQRVIRRMAHLRKEGSTLREIAAAANEAGERQRNGQPWHPQNVRAVLLRAGVGVPTRRDLRRRAGRESG